MYRRGVVVGKFIARMLLQVRRESSWVNRRIVGAVVVILGLAADFLTPWFNVLGWIFPISFLGMFGGFLLWWRSWRRSTTDFLVPRERRFCASLTMYGFVSSIVLAPIFVFNVAISSAGGAMANIFPGVVEAQNYLAKRFDRIERAINVLTESTARQEESLDAVQDTMELSVAIDLVDRARAVQDGSNQGQIAAIELLISKGFGFSGSDFSGVSLVSARLDRANFSDSRLHFVNLDHGRLRGANFSGSGLRFATALGTDFSGADLSNIYAPFFEAAGAKFTEAKITRANFYGANLSGADFSGADLTSATFAFADLRGANLQGANLTGTYFTGTLLQNANMTGAVFGNTNMLGAALDPATLTEAQRAATCRHSMDGSSYFDIKLIERWPSDRFSSGYEFENLTSYLSFGGVPTLDDLSLPACLTATDLAIGFDANFPTYQGMHVDRSYLEKAGRRRSAVERVEAFAVRLQEGQIAGPQFVVGGKVQTR